MLKAVFFDLDGTLLPMDETEFTNEYFKGLFLKVMNRGYDKDTLIKTVWDGTKKMFQNDGTKTNEEVFWNHFESVYGKEKLADKEIFDDFYVNEFENLKSACGKSHISLEIVEYAKNMVDIVVLSTNPIFPYAGTKTRMAFADLTPDMFDFVTAYENFNYSKPNPMYFKALLDKFNLKPEEVIVFGNNDYEDYYCATKAGLKCYLTGNVMTHPELKLDITPVKLEDIKSIIDKEIEERK